MNQWRGRPGYVRVALATAYVLTLCLLVVGGQYQLEKRRADSLAQALGDKTERLLATEAQLAATEDRLYHAESRLNMVEHGVLLPKTLRDALRKAQADGGNPLAP